MITVITPVFNAENFLEKTIQSVLLQPEVTEHILIDDGSTDSSWKIIEKYANQYKSIKGIKHFDGKNHGRSKTRNLGIQNASNDLIAFLDADDFYLENRFKNDIKILSKDPTIDGVYNAIGVHFYDSYKGDKNIPHVLTTLKEEVAPENLFEKMSPFGNYGYFSGDGFIIKKDAILDVGGFNESLSVAEDTELWLKLALKYKLQFGDLINPVTKRGVHDKNVFNKESYYFKPRLLMYKSLLVFANQIDAPVERRKLIISKYLGYLKKYSKSNLLVYFYYWFGALKLSFFTFTNVYFYKAALRYLAYILHVPKLFKR